MRWIIGIGLIIALAGFTSLSQRLMSIAPTSAPAATEVATWSDEGTDAPIVSQTIWTDVGSLTKP